LKKQRPRITEAGKAEIEVEGQILTRDRVSPRFLEIGEVGWDRDLWGYGI